MKVFVNIPKNNEIYWAYKRPQVTIKIQSNGNGVKTVLTNMSEIASALNIPDQVVMKYLGMKIGACSGIKKNQSFLTGRYTVEMIEDVLEQLIAEFLLCSRCGIAEINFYKQLVRPSLPVREPILRQCLACGHYNSSISHDSKMFSILMKCDNNHQWMKVKVSPKARSLKYMFDNLRDAILPSEDSCCGDGVKCIPSLSDISIVLN
ncbi:hypothetical protein C9374_013804 [Naegleria lovaniensis]|uniref:Translation initiation factor IF2/IF5 domain-containing protein n=1 Tax=Naegleria lovaniensis TaxID=51637 RepID=A0AA88GBB7_NAELO|nr:uncharacterized protein C9374_013804 [Naegleria lovaniensis]KAG2370848.1 hypothetical protein C9374_013804 [Naegleria lovaniensis]